MASYYDWKTGRTRCGRCDSKDWNVLSDCAVCGNSCCDDCAVLEGASTLICQPCCLRRDLEALGVDTRKPIKAALPKGTHEEGVA